MSDEEIRDEQPVENQSEEPEAEQEASQPEGEEDEYSKIKTELENLKRALREEREKRKELRELNEQLQLSIREMQEKAKPQQEEEEPDPDSYVTVDLMKKMMAKELQKTIEAVRSEQAKQVEIASKLSSAEAEARKVYPDYDEVIKELIPVLNANPQLKNMIFSDPEKAPEIAYTFAKGLKAQKSTQVLKESEAESLIKSKGPQTLSAVSRGTAHRKSAGKPVEEMTLEEYGEYVKNLSPSERRKLIGLE